MLHSFRPGPAATAIAAGLAVISHQPLAAQAVVQPLGQTDADLLAAQMRQLASNPRDLSALVAAGDLSLRLGDLSGAAALYARADKIDSRDGRVKAGMGSVLVRSERPGEALRFYQQAERAGLAPATFAADRGLAYDLIGQPVRAQNDYRLALAANRADETVRRYALSLGISGRRDEALAALDPLVRRQDRAAWRARAFVLAMNGDTAGANKIATTMMPAQLAQGLSAFFARLPALGTVDRAFAVHFGEVYPTPERVADARLIPPLPPLAGEAPVPTQVAARAPSRRTGARLAAAPPPAAATREQPISAVVMAPPRPVVQPVPSQPAPRNPAPVAVAARPVATPTPVRTATARPAPVPAAPPPTRVAQAPVAPVESHASTRRADAVLARIVASLTIPASELGVGDPAPAASVVEPEVPAAVAAASPSAEGQRVVAGASAKEARDTAVRRVVAARLTGDAAADDAPAARAVAEPVLTPAQRRAAERKARAEKQAAAEKKALADKAAAEKKAARAHPSRIWVQVASGANARDLGRAWSGAKAKAPANLGKRAGYTTSFKATNRVLTGPFKTDAEARAFVNALAKEGVASFAFTSDPGQQVERLAGK